MHENTGFKACIFSNILPRFIKALVPSKVPLPYLTVLV